MQLDILPCIILIHEQQSINKQKLAKPNYFSLFSLSTLVKQGNK